MTTPALRFLLITLTLAGCMESGAVVGFVPATGSTARETWTYGFTRAGDRLDGYLWFVADQK